MIGKQNETRQKKGIDAAGVVVSGLLILIAIGALVDSQHFSPLGSIFPLVAGTMLLILSLLALLQAVRGTSRKASGVSTAGLTRTVLFVLVVAIWIATLEWIGFLLGGIVCFIALAFISNHDALTFRRMAIFVICAIVTVYFFNLVFVDVLKVNLPQGILGPL